MKDSQLQELSTKSCVLTKRVRLLEAEINKLLAAEHLTDISPTQSSAPTPQSEACHHCVQLVTEVGKVKDQL